MNTEMSRAKLDMPEFLSVIWAMLSGLEEIPNGKVGRDATADVLDS